MPSPPLPRLPIALLWAVGAVACAPIPEPCPTMCAAAVPVKQACLEQDGRAWEDTTWASAEGFRASCETWAWQTRRLEADARRRGALDGGPTTAEACESRLEALDEGRCEDLDAAGWDLPWE